MTDSRRRDAAVTTVYGTLRPPYLYETLPLPAALYGVLVWPFIWGFTEQMTYNSYLAPRFQVLCRSTALAVAIVAFAWSFRHVVMPLLFDAKIMTFRLLSAVPNTAFQIILYLRLRRLIPFAIAHALMDGAGVPVGVLLPLLRDLCQFWSSRNAAKNAPSSSCASSGSTLATY